MKRNISILVFLVLGAVAALFLYAGSAAEARLANTWPQVEGKEIPVPYPLSEDELSTLRAQAIAEQGEAGIEINGEVPASKVDAQPLDQNKLATERAIERGSYLANKRLACVECHGTDFSGKLVVDAQPVWTWYAPNITRGGVVKEYTSADWDRLIRHGVKPDDTNATMPAIDYMSLSDREVSDLIVYLGSLPASDVVQPPTVLGPVGKMLLAFGKMPIAAEEIDHSLETAALPPEEGLTVEYGRHIAQPCAGCHRLNFAGGPIAAGPPDWPPAGNLTPAEGGFKGWTEADFLLAMREGKRPDGSDLNPAMPWPILGKLSDLELKSMWLYLASLEPAPMGS